ncbi:MAG: NAD(P)H-hydrate dehydratase [Candidatus Weimeria sp.]
MDHMNQMETMTMMKAKELLPERTADSNKGTYGKLLIIAGRKECAGCAILSSLAALRSGLGMVKTVSSRSNFTALMGTVPEALFSSDTDDASIRDDIAWADAVLIGPGIGTGNRAKRLVNLVLSSRDIPVVIDADGINVIALNEQLQKALRKKTKSDEVVLTPHLMEMSRLCGLPVPEIKKKMKETAARISASYGVTTALKDAATVTASPDGRLILNSSGNNGMSTAGSGDVLSGVVGSFLAQSLPGFEAASLGVYVHGMAGDVAAEKYGVRGMKALDIAESLPEALLKIEG